MALSLTEAARWTTNEVKRGIIEQIIKDSPVMGDLPFQEVVGNALQYQREATLPTAEFYDVNEIWSESTGATTQHTATIKILGGDADVDNFIVATRSNYNDITAETIAAKAKAVRHTFLDRFYYGNSTTSSKEFDGLHTIFSDVSMSAQNIHLGSGSTGAALTAANMDLAVDLILGEKPDVIMVTRAIRRRLKQYLRGKANIELDFQSYSQDIASWNGIKIHYDDFLTQTEALSSGVYSAKTGGATSSAMFLSFGTKKLSGLQNGGLETVKIGQVQNKDSKRYRIKWYCSIALFSVVAAAIIDGATNVAVTD
jgi:hypothetical protein